ncbi:MAG: hypothetical protein HZB30_03275 [Nitrospirae bacterium]|nr:hypothetical protein [Nitrospirota bacterium]
MKYLKLLIALVIIFNFNNCSTMSVNKQAANLSSITVDRTYQVRVRSGNLTMDKIIYDSASAEFGKYLQIYKKDTFNSLIEIVFTSTSKKGFTGSIAGYTTNVLYGDTWYTGDDNLSLKSYNPMAGTEIIPGGIWTSQSSTMMVTIKDIKGEILWNAQYNYKGAYEASGLYVKTSDEAARISIDRIIKQFEKDFLFIPKAENKIQDKKPDFALIEEKQKAPESQDDTVTEETVPDKK